MKRTEIFLAVVTVSRDEEDDRTVGFSARIDGDPVRIESRYVDGLDSRIAIPDPKSGAVSLFESATEALEVAGRLLVERFNQL